MRGHHCDVLARGDGLKLDIIAKQRPEPDRSVGRKRAVPAFGRLEPYRGVRRQAEPLGGASHQFGTIGRDDAQMVSRPVGNAFRQFDFDVPGRAVGRCGACLVLKLAVREDLHWPCARLPCHRMSGFPVEDLDRIERLRRRLVGKIDIEAERLSDGREKALEPVLELPVEILAGIALAARRDPLGADTLQPFVDAPGRCLESRCPVPVSAAEHRVANALARPRRGRLQPVDELDRVVWRRAVVGCARNHHGSVGRQLAGIVVELGQRGFEAVELRRLGDVAGKLLGRAEVRSVKHGKRRPVARPLGGRLRAYRVADAFDVCPRHQRASLQVRARTHPDLEAIRLDRQRFLDLQLVVLVIEELEPLQDHAEDQRRLLHGELPSDTGALAVAERLEGPGRPLRHRLAGKVLGIERLRVLAPHALVAVEHQRQQRDEGSGLHLVSAADHLVLVRVEPDRRRRRPQPQRFVEDLLDVFELVDLSDRRRHGDVAAEHPVDLGVGLVEHVGIVEQEVDRKRHQARRRLVTGDQEGVDLIADILIREAVAGLLVDAGQHEVEQVVLALVAAAAPPLADDLVDQPVHEVDVFPELLEPAAQHHFFERQAALHHAGFKGAGQRIDERVIVTAVERVEAVVETADADRVERQRGHVMHHVDLVVDVQPLPFEAELPGDIEHHREIVGHRPMAEGRQQDAMRLGPVGLLRLAGEQRIARHCPHPAQRAAHRLVEPLLVADFLDQIGTRHDDQRCTHHVEAEDRPVFTRELHEALQRPVAVDREHVADDRLSRRAGNQVLRVRSRHRCSSLFPH